MRNEERERPPKKFASFVGWGWRSNATTTRGSIKCATRSSFHTLKSHGQNSEGGEMGSTCIDWTTAGKPKNHLRNSLARYKRKSFLHRIVTGDEKWIYFENPKRKRSLVTNSRRTGDIDCKTKSLWTEDNALCLVGSKGSDLLWTAETWRNR